MAQPKAPTGREHLFAVKKILIPVGDLKGPSEPGPSCTAANPLTVRMCSTDHTGLPREQTPALGLLEGSRNMHSCWSLSVSFQMAEE